MERKQLLGKGEGAAAAAVGLVEGVHTEPGLDDYIAVLELVLAARPFHQLGRLARGHDVVAHNITLIVTAALADTVIVTAALADTVSVTAALAFTVIVTAALIDTFNGAVGAGVADITTYIIITVDLQRCCGASGRFCKKVKYIIKTSYMYYVRDSQGWASVLFKRTFRSLRSFPFFIKECSDLCVLFRSL